MINLARQVHQQADEAEDPDVAGKRGAGAHAPLIAAASCATAIVTCSRTQYCAARKHLLGCKHVGGSSPAALAARFTPSRSNWVADGPAERAERARRKLLGAIAEQRARDAQPGRRGGRPRRAGGQPLGRCVGPRRPGRAHAGSRQPPPPGAAADRRQGRDELAQPAAGGRRVSRRSSAASRTANSARSNARSKSSNAASKSSAVAIAAARFPALLGGCAAAATNGPWPSFLPPLSCLLTVAPGALFGFLLAKRRAFRSFSRYARPCVPAWLCTHRGASLVLLAIVSARCKRSKPARRCHAALQHGRISLCGAPHLFPGKIE